MVYFAQEGTSFGDRLQTPVRLKAMDCFRMFFHTFRRHMAVGGGHDRGGNVYRRPGMDAKSSVKGYVRDYCKNRW